MKSKYLILPLCLIAFAGLTSCVKKDDPQITRRGESVILQNGLVSFCFDLSNGNYSVSSPATGQTIIDKAGMRINNWSSDGQGQSRVWEKHRVKNEFGSGLALHLKISGKNQPDLLFTVTAYKNQPFLDLATGVSNTLDSVIRIKEIHVLENGKLYPGHDVSHDFAMVDGFSGGEPLEYGQRFYSPLTRRNALKSRNNILLTFKENDKRNTLIMGGLTYSDFEKYATVEQARRIELMRGADGRESLLSYLNLPVDTVDRQDGKETLSLLKGKKMKKWQYHEFYCTEAATTAVSDDEIIVEAKNLNPEARYTLGFSWWRSLWHGNRLDHFQSVYVEYLENGGLKRLPLFENQILPLYDGVKKEGISQVEVPLPAAAVKSGSLKVLVTHADWSKIPVKSMAPGQKGRVDPNVYLSEIWLRNGNDAPMLPATFTELDKSPAPKRAFTAQLFATDPVGKRVDPGQTYQPADRFYINANTTDPFAGLEQYAIDVKTAQKVKLSMYDFPTVCLWYAENSGYGGGKAENTTLGAVNEMTIIKNKGFLKYSRASVRLVPDSYLPDNQQGWWDDKHWQRSDVDHNASKNGQYVEPYETSEKWGKAVTELGGIPLTYIQTAFRSEDYAKAFPEHMLFNKRYAWRAEPQDTSGPMFKTWQQTWTRNVKVWGYDYTDPGFLKHMEEVYRNLKAGGIRGLMFDYPFSGWASGGGMEDDYSTTGAAYRKIFQLAYDGLGPESYVDERLMEKGSDVTLGWVASMRTENDTDEMDGVTVTRCGLCWYKNRVLYNQDTDSKNIVRLEGNRDKVRAVLTMAYVTTGRFLLANSFSQFSDSTYWDVTRTFPYHTTPQTARPVDAFVSDIPRVYDFRVNDEWHQVTFYNSDPDVGRTIGIRMAGEQADGALNLKPDRNYLVYDFWNDRFCGVFKGDSRIEQTLRPGEARMLSVREQTGHPQVVSTNRHVMQGYLDMENPAWNPDRKELSAISHVIGDDPYILTIACNGRMPSGITTDNPSIQADFRMDGAGLAKVILRAPKNGKVIWTVAFRD